MFTRLRTSLDPISRPRSFIYRLYRAVYAESQGPEQEGLRVAGLGTLFNKSKTELQRSKRKII